MTDYSTIEVELLDEGTLLKLTLASGKGNVIDIAMLGELRSAVETHGSNQHLHALLIDHAGKHFSFGASVEEHVPGKMEEMLPGLHACARELVHTNLPILVATRGMNLGGGLEVAGLAHRIFASPDARFAQPEIQLGVFAPLGSLLLPELVGRQNAADLLLSGRTIDAEEALKMGLVAELADDPGAAMLAWAREHLAPKSAAALRYATVALRHQFHKRFLAALAEVERTYLEELMATADAQEGIAAFIAKRKPVWKDC